jgi:TP901 family phage tail tape measure protein
VAVQTLAEAALIIRPDFSQATQGVGPAGDKAGQAYGQGFKRGADGKLRDASGKFVNDSTRAGEKAGSNLARGFGSKAKSGILSSLKDTAKLAAGFLVPSGIAAAIGEIAKIGMAYENNLNIFQSVTNATGAQMSIVSAKARQLGADTKLPGVSAAGAALAMTELAKSGLSVAQAMDAARATLQLARAASIDEGKAAEITGNAINTFKLKARDTTFVVDELAAAANSSSVEIGDVSNSFKMAGAVFSAFQGPAVGSKEAITELNTAIAILGNNGIKGSDAGTSLKQMMLQLTGPTQQAKDLMKELALRAQGATISLSEQNTVLHGSKAERKAAVAEILKHNMAMKNGGDIAFTGAGKMRSLADIISLVTTGTKGMTQEERAYAVTQIFGADASRAVIALMKGGAPVYEAQRKAVLRVGAASDVAAAKNKGLSGAIDNVRSQMENAAISIYNQVKGPLTKGLNGLADEMSKTFDWIGKHTGDLANVGRFAAIAAAAWATYTLAVKANNVATIVWATIQTGIAWVQLLGSVRTFRDLWAAVTLVMDANPIGAIVLAIAALTAGVIYAYKHWSWFKTAVDAVWKALQIAFHATVDWIVNTAWPALVAAWHGIAAGAKWMWEKVIKPAVDALVWEFQNVIAPVALWLWHNILEPVWKGISWAVKAAVAVMRLVIAVFIYDIKQIGKFAVWLWKNAIVPAWNGIMWAVKLAIQAIKIEIAALVWVYQHTLGPVVTWLWKNVFGPAWRAISSAVSSAWDFIKPIFVNIGNWIGKKLPGLFKAGVEAIKAIWQGMKDAALLPVRFIVTAVINPLIGGFNHLAKTFHTPEIPKIPGFARGGRIPGQASATDNLLGTIVGPGGKKLGPIQVATGEFIVNAKDTAKALPLLQWINSGMRGGARAVSNMIGRPITDYPGDGSEGYAFKDGGLVGFLKDVWGAVQDPSKLIKAPLEAAMKLIPGGGTIKDWLLGMGHQLISGLTHFLTTFGGTSSNLGGKIGAAQSFVKAQNGKPYVWASAGPGGYDCSGIVSAAYNILKGRNPYSHTFSTESLPGNFFHQGNRSGPLIAGWSHPGQAPASASVGHMAGNIAGLPFESRGSRGVIVGPGARAVGSFANIGSAYSDGGLVRVAKIAKADFGAVTLAPGMNMVMNGTGAPEPLVTPGSARMHPDDITALAYAIGGALASGLRSTVPAARVAGRQVGKRPR